MSWIIICLLSLLSCKQEKHNHISPSFISYIDESTIFFSSNIVLSTNSNSDGIIIPFRCVVQRIRPTTVKTISTVSPNDSLDETNQKRNNFVYKITPTIECQSFNHPFLPLRNISWEDLDCAFDETTQTPIRLYAILKITPKSLTEMSEMEMEMVNYMYRQTQQEIRKNNPRTPNWFDPRDIYGLEGYSYNPRNCIVMEQLIFQVKKNGDLELKSTSELSNLPYIVPPQSDDEISAFQHFHQPYISGEHMYIRIAN